MVEFHGHDNSCDLHGPKCAHTGEGQYLTHYRCAKGCDFDVCKACFEEGKQGSYAADEAFANQVTPLMLASRVAAVDAVKALLKEGALPNRRSASLCTALGLAAEHPQGSDVVLILLKAKAQQIQDKKGRTPLIEAAQNGSAESVRHLIDWMTPEDMRNCGVNQGAQGDHMSTPLMRAAQGGKSRLEVLELLLEKSANINQLNEQQRSALFFACQVGQLSTAKALLDKGAKIDGNGMAPLGAACSFGSAEMVKLLLERRADVNIDPRAENGRVLLPYSMCLENALRSGWDDVVRILQDHGAKVTSSPAGRRSSSELSIKSYGSALRSAATSGDMKALQTVLDGLVQTGSARVLNETDQRGQTALWLASFHGHPKVVRTLLEEHADVNKASNHDTTPLCAACYPPQNSWKTEDGAAECVKLLINAKAVIDAADADGDTPLINAVYSKYPKCARLLLEATPPADRMLKNRRRSSAVDLATESPDLFPFLQAQVMPAARSGAPSRGNGRQGAVQSAKSAQQFQRILGDAAEADRTVVVFFTAEWCPPSRSVVCSPY
jgi:ankyrin repeat protein